MTGGLFAILDDIAMLLDDAAVMSKVAAKKTAGLLGDDLAVNAEKATGFQASRELPVIWAISKGSFVNKLIILPLAFILSAYAPWLIIPILLLGGGYLSYEGVEKVVDTLLHRGNKARPAVVRVRTKQELLQVEKSKIRSAVRTDFILSIEIVVITLGTVIEQTLALQIIVVTMIALLATVGVYGVVALLVRMDDVGFFLISKAEHTSSAMAGILVRSGRLLVASLPWVIRTLGVVGTLAMLLVGGGMFTHNIKPVHDLLHFMPPYVADLAAGVAVGAALLSIQQLVLLLRKAIT